jgi:hypothetical protein
MARQWRSFFNAMESLKMKIQNLVRRIFNWKRYRTLPIMLLVITFLLSSGVLPVRSQISASSQHDQLIGIADQKIKEGKAMYKNDQFESALESWKYAEKSYRQAQYQDGVSKSRFYQFQALKGLGMYSQACSALMSAVPLFTPPPTCNDLNDILDKTSKSTYWDKLIEKIDQSEPSNRISILHGLGESLR